MSSARNSLSAAAESAKERELTPLVEESVETLGLDEEQLEAMEAYLDAAWFFGIRTGHEVMAKTRMGQTDPQPVILSMQDEFQELMEGLGEALDSTVGATIAAWNYLGEAWIAGARFWEVEIAARAIEEQDGGWDELMRRLEG